MRFVTGSPVAQFASAAAVLAVLAGGRVALAQDSVATTPGLPGDAVSAYSAGTTGEQINNYIVDLTEIRSSWGQRYAIGPVAKSSVSQQTNFFNHLIASSTISSTMTAPQALLRSSYSLWTTPGAGVNATRNTAPSTESTSGILAQQFAAAFLEFGPGADNIWGNNDDENNIISSIMGVQPKYPQRVYVSRVMAAANRGATGNGNATLGLGTIDSSGNLHLLGDGFNMSLGSNPITNKKTFRVQSQLRGTVLNQISDAGGTETASTRTVGSSSITQTVPGIIPAQLGTRPILMGADLTNNFTAEVNPSPAALTAVQTHLPTGASARGSLGFSPYAFGAFNTSGSPVATAAVMARNFASSKSRSLAAWGVSATGTVTGRTLVEMPAVAGVLIDRDDNFDPANAFGSPENQEFTNYQSQSIYRGANGPVAVTVLANGDLLLAATVDATAGAASVPQGMNNYIAVARINPASPATATWTIAAHTGNAAGGAGGLSKKIYGDNGADGLPHTGDAGEGDNVVDATPIGEICLASETVPGATNGPSLSAPAFDAAGNIYFTSNVELAQTSNSVRRTIALMRANFNPATNAYRLEVLADVSKIVAGRNSGRNYQIQFMSVADADSVDSGTTWSSSTNQSTLAGVSRGSVGYASPLSLGGLIFRAKVVYDTNNDGIFTDPSGGVGGTDEAYNAAMLLLPRRPLADVAGPNQTLQPDNAYTADDIIVFLGAYFAGDLALADVAGLNQSPSPDGALTADDIIVFLGAFFAQQ